MTLTRRGTLIVICNFLVQSLTHGLSTSMGVFYVEWKREFSDQAALISWLATSVLAVLLGTSPLAGALTRHYGVRAVMFTGAFLSASGFLAVSFAENIAVIFITIPFMTGFGSSMAYSCSIFSLAQNFKKHYTLLNGIASAGAGAGMVLWPLLLQVLVNHFTWRGALMVVGGVQLNVAPLALMLTLRQPGTKMGDQTGTAENNNCELDGGNVEGNQARQDTVITFVVNDIDAEYEVEGNSIDAEDDGIVIHCDQDLNGYDDTNSGGNEELTNLRDENGYGYDSESEEVNTKGEHTAAVRVTVPRQYSQRVVIVGKEMKSSLIHSTGLSLIWQNRVYASYLPAALTGGAVFGSFLAHAVSSAVVAGVPRIEAAFLISIVGIANMTSRVIHGLLLKTGHIHQMMLLAFSFYLCSVALFVMPNAPSYAVMVACAAAVGIGSGIYIPLQFSCVRHMVSLHRFPGAVGMTLFSVCIGIMITSSVSGYILDLTNSYKAAFYFSGAIGLLPGSIILIIHVIWNYCIIDDRWPPKVNPTVKQTKEN